MQNLMPMPSDAGIYSCVAPMDGITDAAYRRLVYELFGRYGHRGDATMMYTEFMSAAGYLRNPRGVVEHMLTIRESGYTIAQIYAGDRDELIATAHDLERRYAFGGIELNIGCPSPKVMACGGGVGMLQDKQTTKQTIIALAQSIELPFSIKTRVGLTTDDRDEWFEVLCAVAPYCASIAVHGRTYKQGHRGDVDRDYIYRLKDAVGDATRVIGNGGITTYDEAKSRCLFGGCDHDDGGCGDPGDDGKDCEHYDGDHVGATTSCTRQLDGVMSAQGAIGNPWMIVPHVPSMAERHHRIRRHLQLAMGCELWMRGAGCDVWLYDDDNAESGVTLRWPRVAEVEHLEAEYTPGSVDESEQRLRTPWEFRKHLFRYISGIPGSKALKHQIAQTTEYHALCQLIDDFFGVADTGGAG